MLADNADLKAYQEILQALYQRFVSAAGPEEAELLFDFSRKGQPLQALVDMDIQGVRSVHADGARALELFLHQVSGFYDRKLFNELRALAVKEAVLHRLPLPMDALYQSSETQVIPASAGLLDELL